MTEGQLKKRPAVLRTVLDTCIPFAVGCTSGMVAAVIVQPLDTLKVRMQLTDQSAGRRSQFTIAKSIVAQDGFWNLYQGLSAGLLRQLVYGTLRLGLFATFEQRLERRAEGQGTTLGFGGRALAGISAGALAAFVGTPTEVALIQMQADSMRPTDQRLNYTSVVDTIKRLVKQEGVLSLWKGTGPTIVRAMSTNFGQLAFFSESKHQIQKYSSMSREKRTTLAATIAGFAGSFLSQPFDFVKTRLQNQAMGGSTGRLQLYAGTMDCFAKVLRTEGVMRFYRDFWPYFLKVAPQSIAVPFSEPPWLPGQASPYYTESHRKWQKTCYDFISEHLTPYALGWERDGEVPAHIFETFTNTTCSSLPCRSLPIESLKKAGITELLGGLQIGDFDYFHFAIYISEMRRLGISAPTSSLSTGTAYGIPPIITSSAWAVAALRPTDVNPVVLERGRNLLVDRYGVPAEDWVTFRIADRRDLLFEDGSFDVVHCHQVLAHNKGQAEIPREILRVTKPGGVVAAREGDMETEVFRPPLPGPLKLHDEPGAALWALEANGGDRSKITTSFTTGMVNGALNSPKVRESNFKSRVREADMDEMRDAWLEWHVAHIELRTREGTYEPESF
ncbi:hypothetical protein SCUP515_10619 [Seiridium cupressi]